MMTEETNPTLPPDPPPALGAILFGLSSTKVPCSSTCPQLVGIILETCSDGSYKLRQEDCQRCRRQLKKGYQPIKNPYLRTPEKEQEVEGVQPPPGKFDQESLMCDECGSDPCLWLRVQPKILELDKKRGNAPVGGNDALPGQQTNHSRRRCSIEASARELGIGIPRRYKLEHFLPVCFVNGIFECFPICGGWQTKGMAGVKRIKCDPPDG